MADTPMMEIRRDYLRQNRPRQYRTMQQDGTLDEHLRDRAASCGEKYREYLRQGVETGQARSWAIREILLDQEPD